MFILKNTDRINKEEFYIIKRIYFHIPGNYYLKESIIFILEGNLPHLPVEIATYETGTTFISLFFDDFTAFSLCLFPATK